jgi:perosamine synthetase
MKNDEPMKIRFASPYTTEEDVEAVAEVIRSRWLVSGPKVDALEAKFREMTGARYAIAVSSWTTGGFLALKAMGIGPGDEVIVPSLTYIATANVVQHCGATPVFADIDPLSYNIDPDDIERKITDKTRAIIPVDQIGMPCEIDLINDLAAKHGLKVIDDAACATGARFRGKPLGALTDVTIFSLHARKLVTAGEGGMILTDDESLATTMRLLSRQGMSITDAERHGAASRTFETDPLVGYNFRLSDIAAALALVQIGRLDEIVAKRRELAARYNTLLADVPWVVTPHEPEHCESCFQSYMIGLTDDAPLNRGDLMDYLDSFGVTTRRGIMASHLEPVYAGSSPSLPATEKAVENTVLLPLHHELTAAEQEYVVRVIAKAS